MKILFRSLKLILIFITKNKLKVAKEDNMNWIAQKNDKIELLLLEKDNL